MDIYGATLTTIPLLLLALLVEMRAFGPRAWMVKRQERRAGRRADRFLLGYIAASYAVAVLGLATEWDHVLLRLMCGCGLGLAGFAFFVTVNSHVTESYIARPSDLTGASEA